MRILHTSDWHLGRLFHEVHLTEDQAYVLSQLVALMKDLRPDVMIVSGDIYDRAVPPPEAVTLLDEILSQIVLGHHIPVIMIAGNHDSPDRLAFGSSIMEAKGLFISGPFQRQVTPVILEDRSGPIYFYPLPYSEPAVMRERLADESLKDHNAGLAAVCRNLRQRHPKKMRSVLITHAFVAGGEECESERPLCVGGAGTVDASCFEDFHYVALGHLHRPQDMGERMIQYPGSLLKYSFTETDHDKSVTLIEMDSSGACRSERIRLSPLHNVRRIEGYLNDLIRDPEAEGDPADYLSVKLLDEGALLNAMGKLREVFPHVLHLERPFLSQGTSRESRHGDHRRMSDAELFADFYVQVMGEALSEEQRETFGVLVDAMRRREREVSA